LPFVGLGFFWLWLFPFAFPKRCHRKPILLAVTQILLGSRTAQSQNLRLDQDRHDDRRTIEEALDVAGEDIGEELEQLLKQLDTTAGKIGQKFERWAEENAEELEAWSEKHGAKWEKFGERFGQTMESIADDQEGIWSRWAKRYERDLKRWEQDLQSDELSAENIGRFVDDNLEALSRMPLGQLVDQALEDGIGELRKAPWDSLEELGLLAQDALQEPVDELAGLTIEGAKARRALDRSAQKMGRSLRQLSEDLERNISDSDLQGLLDNEPAPRELLDQDPRVKRLKELLQREDINKQQRQSIEEMIDAIRSSDLRPTRDETGISNGKKKIRGLPKGLTARALIFPLDPTTLSNSSFSGMVTVASRELRNKIRDVLRIKNWMMIPINPTFSGAKLTTTRKPKQ